MEWKKATVKYDTKCRQCRKGLTSGEKAFMRKSMVTGKWAIICCDCYQRYQEYLDSEARIEIEANTKAKGLGDAPAQPSGAADEAALSNLDKVLGAVADAGVLDASSISTTTISPWPATGDDACVFGTDTKPEAPSNPDDGASASDFTNEDHLVVKLISYSSSKKIQLIKAVRHLTGLGIKEAKDIIENTPSEFIPDKNRLEVYHTDISIARTTVTEMLEAAGAAVVVDIVRGGEHPEHRAEITDEDIAVFEKAGSPANGQAPAGPKFTDAYIRENPEWRI